MSIITTPEFFINMKSYPMNKDSKEYLPFWREEKRKCEDGVTINGVYISGWLYWHINHWRIWIDEQDEKGRVQRVSAVPKLRDNEWLIAEAEQRALDEKKGLIMIGTRQFGKSEFIASYSARTGILYRGSQNVVVSSNADDLDTITSKIDFGLTNCSPYFRVPRITRNWNDGEVLMGVKDKKGDNIVYSSFRIRNTQEGRKTEVTAGATMKSLIYDEVGKAPFKNSFVASMPALLSEFGWRCIPIMVGTGGNFDKGDDAADVFYNTDDYKLLTFPHSKKPGVTVGLFVPGTYRQDAKVEKNLAEYMNVEAGTELDSIKIKVKDEEKAINLIKSDLEAAAKDRDPKVYLKIKAYYPLEEEDCFLQANDNIFPVDLLQKQLEFIEQNGIQPTCVELTRELDGRVIHTFTDKKPVSNFPVKPKDNLDAPVQIWEFPKSDSPIGLNTGGTDPYKQSHATYSTSLGCTYIFKRIHNLTGEGWQNIIVACITSRPKDIYAWYEQTKLLLEYYNCKTLCENMDYGFIQHCVEKNVAHKYLERTPRFLTDVHPNSRTQRDFGIHMTLEIKQYLVSCILEYISQEIDFERDENGNAVKARLGVTRILDPMLIKELIKFNYKGNFDRVIAFGLALAQAKDLNNKIIASSQEDTRYTAYSKRPTGKSPFRTTTSTPFIS